LLLGFDLLVLGCILKRLDAYKMLVLLLELLLVDLLRVIIRIHLVLVLDGYYEIENQHEQCGPAEDKDYQ
jgi:hypothetical protein